MDDETDETQHAADEPSEAMDTSGASPDMTPDMEAENPAAGAVPPGYDWPTHGGYLGCLLGLLPGCLVAAFFGSTFIAVLNKAEIVPPIVAGILVALLFIGFMIGFGRVGWLLGRRYYRKYTSGVPTWGEDDIAPAMAGDAGDSTRNAEKGDDDTRLE